MVKTTFALIIFSLFFCLSCNINPNERKIEGSWILGYAEFEFKKGIISYQTTGAVFGTYKFIDKNIIRYQRQGKDSSVDWLVEIEFKTGNKMIWYRKIRDKKIVLYKWEKDNN